MARWMQTPLTLAGELAPTRHENPKMPYHHCQRFRAWEFTGTGLAEDCISHVSA